MGKLLYLIMFEMYGRVAVLIKKKKKENVIHDELMTQWGHHSMKFNVLIKSNNVGFGELMTRWGISV